MPRGEYTRPANRTQKDFRTVQDRDEKYTGVRPTGQAPDQKRLTEIRKKSAKAQKKATFYKEAKEKIKNLADRLFGEKGK